MDIILENAVVVDGSGSAPFRADVGVAGESIRAVGDLREVEAGRRVNVEGKVICPGFIDVHSHADLSLFRDDHDRVLEPLVRQGITTFVGGNCGMGLAPFTRHNLAAVSAYLEVFTQMDFRRDVRWENLGEFMEFVEKKGLLLNAALLVPHGVMRASASGLSRRPCTAEEMAEMRGMLKESMEAGAFGISAGLQYFPGNSADTAEVAELAGMIAPYEGIFACHLRSYTNTTLGRAFAEVGEVARTGDIRGHVSHIFSIPWFGPLQRPLLRGLKWLARHPQVALRFIPSPLLDMEMKRILGYLERERKEGAVMSMDVMPTTAGFTHLLAFFPPWVLEGTGREVMARLRDPAVRRRILEDIERGKPAWPHRGRNDWSLNIMRQLGWDAVTVMAVHSEKNRHLEGRRFVDIAAEQGKHPLDAMCDLLLEEEGEVLVFESLSEPDDPFTERYTYPALLDPETMITTDTILLGIGKPSYLFYGCYPRFIHRYVFEKGLLGLPEAVRRCTSLPAERFGIAWRGLVREGYFADLLVMDAPRFSSEATFLQPDVFPVGLDIVLLNGQVVVEEGKPIPNIRAGKMLRRNDQRRPE